MRTSGGGAGEGEGEGGGGGERGGTGVRCVEHSAWCRAGLRWVEMSCMVEQRLMEPFTLATSSYTLVLFRSLNLLHTRTASTITTVTSTHTHSTESTPTLAAITASPPPPRGKEGVGETRGMAADVGCTASLRRGLSCAA